jgi:hypothetical protein
LGGEGLGCSAEEAGAGGGGLVGVDLGVGQAGVVVDGAVFELITDPWPGAGGVALGAVTSVDASATAVA